MRISLQHILEKELEYEEYKKFEKELGFCERIIKVPKEIKIEINQSEEDERPPESFSDSCSSTNSIAESESHESDYFDDDDHLRI